MDISQLVGEERAAHIKKEAAEQADAINNYLQFCEKEPGYNGYKVGWEMNDFINNKVTVIVYYTDGYLKRKF